MATMGEVDKRLEADRIIRAVNYDPATGICRWRFRPLSDFQSDYEWGRWNKMWAGKITGTKNGDGYLCLKLNEAVYKEHHVAWLLSYGHLPSGCIDHINGNRADNRLVNLRDVTMSDNGKNRRLTAKSASGQLGVWLDRRYGKWVAQIRVNGKSDYLGRHEKYEEAVAARKAAELAHGFHSNHGLSVKDIELKHAYEGPVGEMRLNYEGALADLDSALNVLISRIKGERDLDSAATWLRLNYPKKAAMLSAAPSPEGGS